MPETPHLPDLPKPAQPPEPPGLPTSWAADANGHRDRADDGPAVVRPGDWTVVPITGDLDFYSAPGLADVVRALTTNTAGPHRVVLDLRQVEFMDSTGLRILLGMARDLRENGGALRLAGPGDLVVRLLDVTQVAPLLPAYADVAAACRD
ncbi:MAG TPA: STAS domain-containing protein [Yinghuangia sp.]|uniref:STAS domain-containing protein n=1 Tax=Yinghuangia sp. YIM S10712 TaxID=3436930 RepID=UPI002C530C39|nr:STAS domain-containing protein [Yinghuangia sp.]